MRVAPTADRLAFLVVVTLGALAALSLAQGVLDVGLPLARGEAPFGFTLGLGDAQGPGALYLAILAHNLGLAGLLPGLGFLLAMRERHPGLRRAIPPILLVALVVALGNAFALLLAAGGPGGASGPFRLALYLAEATAILGVASLSQQAFHRRFARRTPDATAVAGALRDVGGPVFAAAIGLTILAGLETHALLAG